MAKSKRKTRNSRPASANNQQITQSPKPTPASNQQKAQDPKPASSGLVVKIANGAGTEPIAIPWVQGDTVDSVLKRAGVRIESGRTATLGRRRVRNPEKTDVKAGEVIVIAGKPSNG